MSVCRAIVALLSNPEPDSPLNCDAGNRSATHAHARTNIDALARAHSQTHTHACPRCARAHAHNEHIARAHMRCFVAFGLFCPEVHAKLMRVPTPSHAQNPRACTHSRAPARTALHRTIYMGVAGD